MSTVRVEELLVGLLLNEAVAPLGKPLTLRVTELVKLEPGVTTIP